MSITHLVGLSIQRRWWSAALICGVATGVFAVFMVIEPARDRLHRLARRHWRGVAAAIGAACCFWSVRSATGRLRAAWYLLGAASGSWAIGEGIWCWYQLARNVEVPFPSFADLFFLLAVPLMAAGVVLLARESGAVSGSVRVLLDGAIIAGSLLFISWATALGSAWHSGGESEFARIVGLAYPVGDVITATVAIAALARARGTYRRSLVLLGAGVISLAVSDSMFAYLTQNGTYGNGNWLDTGWVAGFLLIGLAALTPSRATASGVSPKGQSTAQLVLPYIPLGFAGATAAVEELRGHPIGNFLLGVIGATTALVMARQLLTLLDNRRLNRTLESTVAALEAREVDLARQAFHDPLTGLVNRVLFTDRLNHALERQSREHGTLAVMLCDLDDFKAVNDSLGHLAGDEVLKQVASRLQSSVRQADTIARPRRRRVRSPNRQRRIPRSGDPGRRTRRPDAPDSGEGGRDRGEGERECRCSARGRAGRDRGTICSATRTSLSTRPSTAARAATASSSRACSTESSRGCS